VYSAFPYSPFFLFALRVFPFNFFVALSNEQSAFASIAWAFRKRITDVINFKGFHYISVMMWLCIYIRIKGVPFVAFLYSFNARRVNNTSYWFQCIYLKILCVENTVRNMFIIYSFRDTKIRSYIMKQMLSVSRLSRECGRLDVSQTYEPLRPFTGISSIYR
jgi:hypothetical protein